MQLSLSFLFWCDSEAKNYKGYANCHRSRSYWNYRRRNSIDLVLNWLVTPLGTGYYSCC